MRPLDVFRSRRVLVIALLGFASGLPLLLTAQTLTAWLKAEDLDVREIGDMAAVGLPYTFKWLWAPLLDRWSLPWLGRRRGWLLVLQLALIAAIATMGSIDPHTQREALWIAAIVVAFLSASQDIVVDAFNADTLRADERAAGSAMYVAGYRTAMLIAGTLALFLADHVPWRTIYVAVAALMSIGIVGTLLAREPEVEAAPPPTLDQAVWRPFALLLTTRRVGVLLAFVALFRFGEHLGNHLVIPFLADVGFTFTEIAALYKALGFTGTITGAALAAVAVPRFGMKRCLVAFGVLQATTNLGYLVLAYAGASMPVFGAVVVIDNVASAMGTGVFVAYLMSRCDRSVSATQYALLTSLSSVGGRVFGFVGGDLAATQGWPAFWAISAAAVIPALVLIAWLPVDDTIRS